jgi:hypothetical protein
MGHTFHALGGDRDPKGPLQNQQVSELLASASTRLTSDYFSSEVRLSSLLHALTQLPNERHLRVGVLAMTRKVQGLHDYRWKGCSNLHSSLAKFDHNSVALEVKVCCVRPKHSLPFELVSDPHFISTHFSYVPRLCTSLRAPSTQQGKGTVTSSNELKSK